MSKVVRSVKNVTKGYSSVQVKVRNATSNDPWGPTGTDMSEIAQMTFHNSNDFYEIMDMLDKRLNDKGKNWRHVLKSLKVLDYCLHEGSELVVTWARKNVYIIKTLREFQYIDDDGKDVGQNVRMSAKELTSLIMDEERLRMERTDRRKWKSRVTGIDEFGPQGSGFGEPVQRDRPPRRRHDDEDDAEYRLAIEASKYEAEEAAKRRNANATPSTDDDLAKAIRLSKEEEESRKRELEESNAAALFDTSSPQMYQQQPAFTGYNQGYQQQGQVDFYGNPINPQQMQSTGYLNNAYNQSTGYGTNFQQPQQTGFDPSQYQQASYVQPQQTAFDSLDPYANQQGNANGNNPTPGTHNPWASTQPVADTLKPMPTGSNNPFAAKRPSPQPQNNSKPSLQTLSEQKTATQYNPISNYPVPISQPQPPPPPPSQKPTNPQHERLNALLASGEGMDTFGNTGDLRIPAQHTAPGTFINSAGQGLNRLHANQTGGNNPFFNQQQFTTGGMQFPAQTGPAGGFGVAVNNTNNNNNNNPFGGRGGAASQGGSLIDL